MANGSFFVVCAAVLVGAASSIVVKGSLGAGGGFAGCLLSVWRSNI